MKSNYKTTQQLNKKYKEQWVALKEGKVVAHNPDRRELHKELRTKQLKGVYVTFVGPVVKPGYSVILIINIKL